MEILAINRKLITTLAAVTLFSFIQAPVFADPDDRQERRQERGRSDDRQDRRDCRQEEGAVGEDKRECKQEEMRDGVRGNREQDADSQDDSD